MNKSYLEILLALREEYKKQNQLLAKLKTLTNTNARKVVDFYYWVNKWVANVDPELLCRVTYRNGFVNNYTQDTLLLSSNNGEYFFRDVCGLTIDGKNKDEFDQTAKDVLRLDVAKKMYSGVVKGTNTRSEYSMIIKPSEVRTIINNGIAKGSYINYSSYLDRLTFIDYPDILDSELVKYFLTLDFDIDRVPEYVKDSIVNNERDAKIILPKRLSETGIVELNINEDGNRVQLSKR